MPDLHDTVRLIGADASHHIQWCFLGRKTQAAQILVNYADLQADGAEPVYRVLQVFPLSYQRFERLALAAGGSKAHYFKACLVIAKLQPDNRY